MKYPTIINYLGTSYIQTKKSRKLAIITEYMPNGSLEDLFNILLKGYIVPFWTDTIKLINIYGIAAAVWYLHSKNIIHGDLKPRNVLLDANLFPKLSDFGLSNIVDSNKNIGTCTAVYLPPEFLDYNLISKATDVYSFGFVVLNILVCDKIKNYSMIYNIVEDILTNNFSKTHPELNAAIPRIYIKLIKCCLRQEPEDRPSFDSIIKDMKNNPSYITKNVDKKLFQSYVDFIDNKKQFSCKCYSLESIYKDYLKIMELKDPLSSQVQTLDLSQFEKIKRIGEGGFGKVYLYKNKETNKLYAAKKLTSISNNIQDFTKRVKFSREVTIMSKTSHPCIIKYIGYSPTNINNKPKPIIVTEYMPNLTLSDLLSCEMRDMSIKNWTETMKLINIFGIASAMKYLHSQNILHRDLKPSNILLDSFFFPKLADFGLSKFISQQKQEDDDFNDILRQSSSKVMGTYQYIAPEIYKDANYIKPSDVYSFSMVLYEIVTKKIPFDGLDSNQIAYNVIYKEDRPRISKNVPKIYRKLIQECWNQDPSKRPTFEQIVDDLKTNQEYITEQVDKQLYQTYIEIIEQKQEEEINKNTIIEKGFTKCSLKKEILEYEGNYLMYSNEGFLDLSNYSIESIIEENQLISIYDVVDQKTNSLCSATVSKSIEQYSPFEKSKLTNEVKKLLKVKHPLIQQFYGFSFVDFDHQKRPVSISEYFTRNTLSNILEKERKSEHNDEWNSTTKFILIYKIAYAMFYLHLHNICHPNLNPNNILVDSNFHPKLSKIGFYIQPQNSQSVFGRSSSKMADISLLYLAPEILESQQNIPKSDVYSFALIFYEILSNEAPFKKTNDYFQIISKIVNEKFRPSFEKTGINEETQKLIEKCWSDNPNDRPSFFKILNELETNEKILASNVDKQKYKNSIKQFNIYSCLLDRQE